MYTIYVNNTLLLTLAVHEISRHFWAAYGSTCHAVLTTVELFKGLSELTRLAAFTCKLRLHVPGWLKNTLI